MTLSVLSVFNVQPRVFTREVATAATVIGFGVDDTTRGYLGVTCDGSEEDRFSEVFMGEHPEVTVTRAREEAVLCVSFRNYAHFYKFANITFLARGVE